MTVLCATVRQSKGVHFLTGGAALCTALGKPAKIAELLISQPVVTSLVVDGRPESYYARRG